MKRNFAVFLAAWLGSLLLSGCSWQAIENALDDMMSADQARTIARTARLEKVRQGIELAVSSGKECALFPGEPTVCQTAKDYFTARGFVFQDWKELGCAFCWD